MHAHRRVFAVTGTKKQAYTWADSEIPAEANPATLGTWLTWAAPFPTGQILSPTCEFTLSLSLKLLTGSYEPA